MGKSISNSATFALVAPVVAILAGGGWMWLNARTHAGRAMVASHALDKSEPVAGRRSRDTVLASRPAGRGRTRTIRSDVMRTQPADPIPSGSRSTAALPPAGTAWNEVYKQLWGRAEDGDAQAASRLYVDLQRCTGFHTAQNLVQMTLRGSTDKSVESLADVKRNLDSLSSTQRALAKNESVCATSTATALYRVHDQVVLQAALTGNEDAAVCFAAMGTHVVDGTSATDAAELYRRFAPVFLTEGVQRGDWRMVSLLATDYDPPVPSNMSPAPPAVVQANPGMAYTYTALMEIGAATASKSKEVARLRDSLDYLATKYAMSDREIKSAWARARRFYRDYFTATPYIPENDMTWCW